jgi:hypothetical protein
MFQAKPKSGFFTHFEQQERDYESLLKQLSISPFLHPIYPPTPSISISTSLQPPAEHTALMTFPHYTSEEGMTMRALWENAKREHAMNLGERFKMSVQCDHIIFKKL